MKQYRLEATSEAHDRVKKKFSRSILAKLEGYLPEKVRVVEVGPGDAQFAEACVARGHDYTAIESSKSIQEHLDGVGIEYINATVPPIPLDDGSYELFFASMVLEHMPTYREALGFIDEATRVLSPGGILCLIFPNAYVNGRIFWEMDYTHSYYTTPRRVTQLCTQRGLKVIDVEKTIGWFWVSSTPLHHVVRHLSNLCSMILNNTLVVGLLESIGLGDVAWKFRKTLFESAILIVRKPTSQVIRGD